MKLQEQVSRIQEMMGLIIESKYENYKKIGIMLVLHIQILI